MILKFTGIILILICGTAMGLKASQNLKIYYENCIMLTDMINRIGIMIKYQNLNIYEISRELKKINSFSRLGFIKNLPDEFGDESFNSLWNKAIKNDNSIGIEEKEFLISFSETFGTSDINGQISSIELLIENLKNTEKKRQSEYQKKGRLYRSVGLIAGVMTAILMI